MLCALDCAVTKGSNSAIFALLEKDLLGAIGCLSVSDLWPDTAKVLKKAIEESPTERKPAIGLQLALTAPFSPLSAGFRPENDGFLPNIDQMAKAFLSLSLNADVLEAEFRAQIRRFLAHMKQEPSFLVLDPACIAFAGCARAADQAIRHFHLESGLVLCPSAQDLPLSGWLFLGKPFRAAKTCYKLGWIRRDMQDVRNKQMLPAKSDYFSDAPIWQIIRPAFEDERLVHLGLDPVSRKAQFDWLDQRK